MGSPEEITPENLIICACDYVCRSAIIHAAALVHVVNYQLVMSTHIINLRRPVVQNPPCTNYPQFSENSLRTLLKISNPLVANKLENSKAMNWGKSITIGSVEAPKHLCYNDYVY